MRLLNRMLFFASAPAQRYRLLQRFYTLPQERIERFYAARLTWADKLRILSGKPPVPIAAAFRAMANIERGTSSKPL
jgi:lycopene beta-cyclase